MAAPSKSKNLAEIRQKSDQNSIENLVASTSKDLAEIRQKSDRNSIENPVAAAGSLVDIK